MASDLKGHAWAALLTAHGTNAPVLALKLGSLFSPVRTMTATIAAEMGEVANGTTHYHVLFFIGMVLFLISLGVNVAASSVVFRAKKRAERILS